jgi:hypothetical protein
MKFIALIPLAVMFVVSGCVTEQTEADSRKYLQAKLRTVVYSDGINEQESKIIADAYLENHMGASFGHIGPYDGGASWIFKITGDIAPVELTNVPPVLINKSTGVVTWEAQPPLKQ